MVHCCIYIYIGVLLPPVAQWNSVKSSSGVSVYCTHFPSHVLPKLHHCRKTSQIQATVSNVSIQYDEAIRLPNHAPTHFTQQALKILPVWNETEILVSNLSEKIVILIQIFATLACNMFFPCNNKHSRLHEVWNVVSICFLLSRSCFFSGFLCQCLNFY